MAQNERISDEDWLALKPKLEKSIKTFHGDGTILEGAWGALLVGTQFGWKVSFLMHNQSTIKRYEGIIGVKVRDVCPETTKLSSRNYGYKIASTLSSIWKAIRGEESIPDRNMFALDK